MRLGLGPWLGGGGRGGGPSGYYLAAISDDTPTANNELPVLVDTAATGVLATLVSNLAGATLGVDAAFSGAFSVGSTATVGARREAPITFITGVAEGANDPVLFTADNGTISFGQNIIFEGVGAAPVADAPAAYLMELGFI